MASDAELKQAFNDYKAEKEKYERVRNSIRSHSLNYMRGLDNMNQFIEYCEKIIGIVDGEPGYHYISNLSEHLKEDVKMMTKYRDYVRDANNSFVNLHNLLESKISSLNSQMDRVKDQYNEGKINPFERIWW
ncbi:hypothetical protein [Streptococcus oricebi]|uniref:Uncharacterized protein n=1 Tax=Streptococcus oricebi TaxID=1547447 RepID=A0ABS5B4T5_9STRE|nr:hypothetical protein [Streptococcus oricebi]MBP2623844.1 hypothetical protein [Streptococcus oricebi]